MPDFLAHDSGSLIFPLYLCWHRLQVLREYGSDKPLTINAQDTPNSNETTIKII